MTEFDLLNTRVEASFRKLLSDFNLKFCWPTELRGNTLFIFLPDLEALALWQNSYKELLAAAHTLGITNLRLQDPSLPLLFAEVNIPNILATQVGIELALFQGN